MIRYIINRLITLVPIVIIMSILVFSLMHLIPGDPVEFMLGVNATPEAKSALRHELGLDRNILAQYAGWAGNMLKGDFGKSIISHRPVLDTILEKIPATLLLAFTALIMAFILALITGAIAASRQGTKTDMSVLILALIWVSIPSFWLAILMILAFSLYIPIFPTMGYVSLAADFAQAVRHLFLPSLCLALGIAGGLARMVRSEMIEQLSQDYVTTAWSKGLTNRAIIFKHALKNALLPIVTILGLQLAFLLGGTVVVEQIFSWPGVGRLIVQSVFSRDYPMVQGIVMFLSVAIVGINLVVDISYTLLNPKVRLGANE